MSPGICALPVPWPPGWPGVPPAWPGGLLPGFGGVPGLVGRVMGPVGNFGLLSIEPPSGPGLLVPPITIGGTRGPLGCLGAVTGPVGCFGRPLFEVGCGAGVLVADDTRWEEGRVGGGWGGGW